jgi:hypothetical protein
VDELLERADIAYDRAIFGGDAAALPALLDELKRAEAAIALARGRLLHAKFMQEWDRQAPDVAEEHALLTRAAELYRSIGDLRGQAQSVFFVGCYHHVVHGDNTAALPHFELALELATRAGDDLLRSYAIRHLGVVAHASGDLAEARRLLGESTDLRRALGFTAGVAANLVGLAYVAKADGRDPEALIAEAARLAQESGAHAILRQVEALRGEASQT